MKAFHVRNGSIPSKYGIYIVANCFQIPSYGFIFGATLNPHRQFGAHAWWPIDPYSSDSNSWNHVRSGVGIGERAVKATQSLFRGARSKYREATAAKGLMANYVLRIVLIPTWAGNRLRQFREARVLNLMNIWTDMSVRLLHLGKRRRCYEDDNTAQRPGLSSFD